MNVFKLLTGTVSFLPYSVINLFTLYEIHVDLMHKCL